jgi:hypothetical protein
MRSRLVTFVAIVLAAVATIFAVSRFDLLSSPPSVHLTLPSRAASYLGVYVAGSPPAYEPIARFASVVHSRPNIIGYFGGWTEPFATSFAKRMRRHGVIPFVQIDPTFASVPGIAAGAYDDYLRTYADSVRDFGDAVVIGFGHEMNARWYSWGYGHVPAPTFVARAPGMSPGCGHSRQISPIPGQSPHGGRARAMSPGWASTATTTGPLTRSPASSAAP